MALGFYIRAVCSLIGFVLAILGLFAGNTPGFMEDYQVIMLNTSVLGRNYVPNLNLPTARDLSHAVVLADDAANATTATTTTTTTTTGSQEEEEGAGKRLQPRKLTLAAAEGVLAGLAAATAADDMPGVLGISAFYSLHVMNVCEGFFAPNATAAGAWRNVSGCTTPLSAGQLNLTARINAELGQNFVDGGSLAALGASASLLDALNRVPTLGLVLAVFYLVGAGAAALSVLLTAASLGTRRAHGRETVLANLGAASGAALALLVAALVAAVAARNTVDSINRLGKDTIGMEAVQGTGFTNLTWAAFGLMAVSALCWVRELHADAKAAAAAAAAKKKAAAAAAAKK